MNEVLPLIQNLKCYKYNKMIDSHSNGQIDEIDEEMLLTRQLEKHLGFYTDNNQNQRYVVATLRSSTNQLFTQMHDLLQMIFRIKKAIQVSNVNKEIQNEKDYNQIPEFIIKDINAVVIKNQRDISSVANKLKVLVSKTMQKQSSKLKYNFNSYTTLVSQQLNIDLQKTGFQKMMQQLRTLRKKFKVANFQDMIKHKLHLSECAKFPRVIIYVNFYIEQLLFFQDHPLPFNGNLLFVPLVQQKYSNKQTGKTTYIQILPWYIMQLFKQDANWENFCFQIIIRENKKQNIKWYSHIVYQKKALEDQTCSQLKKMRFFVYFSLIFNFLKRTLILSNSQSNKRSIKLQLNQKYSVEINVQKICNQPNLVSNNQLAKYFLQYFDEQQIKIRALKNKQQVTDSFINYLLCHICGLKYNIEVPQEYLHLKPKYVYVGDKRVKI